VIGRKLSEMDLTYGMVKKFLDLFCEQWSLDFFLLLLISILILVLIVAKMKGNRKQLFNNMLIICIKFFSWNLGWDSNNVLSIKQCSFFVITDAASDN